VTVLSSEHDQEMPIDEAVDLGAKIDDAYQGPGPGDPPANIAHACRRTALHPPVERLVATYARTLRGNDVRLQRRKPSADLVDSGFGYTQ
jgi:hypothetical protein